ncbi:unnamed protein product [Discula destructiva]
MGSPNGELSWRNWSHFAEDVAEMRAKFADAHWKCDSRDELIVKLYDHSKSDQGLYLYKPKSGRKDGNELELTL